MQGSLLTNCFHDDKITLFRVLLAAVAELADALDSKSSAFAGVPVRLRPAAPLREQNSFRQMQNLFRVCDRGRIYDTAENRFR